MKFYADYRTANITSGKGEAGQRARSVRMQQNIYEYRAVAPSKRCIPIGFGKTS